MDESSVQRYAAAMAAAPAAFAPSSIDVKRLQLQACELFLDILSKLELGTSNERTRRLVANDRGAAARKFSTDFHSNAVQTNAVKPYHEVNI